MATTSAGQTARNRPAVIRFLSGCLALSVLFGAQMIGLVSHWPLAWVLEREAPALLFIPLLPLVSYRRRDVFLILFVPFMNLVLAARVGWRLANLPVHDWPPRPDEPGSVEWRAAQDTLLWAD
jgi:hypothetical protein